MIDYPKGLPTEWPVLNYPKEQLKMGNILWHSIKASPKTTGWAFATFIWAFITQLVYVTVAGLSHFHNLPTTEDAQLHDYIWFAYRELPASLPMITVFSASATVLLLVMGPLRTNRVHVKRIA